MVKYALYFLLANIIPLTAYAQIQQGYAGESTTPDVQVDRSVLEDLKGYQPPPMFETQQVEQPVLKAAPPIAPTLTTPKAEDILSHPVENHHVLTEQKPQLTAPAPAPIPVAPVAVPAKEKTSPVKKKSNPTKITTENKPKPSSIKKSDAPDPTDKKIAPTGKYRPQTAKTMPAVPSIAVEKSVLPPVTSPALPALPPTTDAMTERKKPSIGERLMDAALQRHIETDDTKIKETLETKPVKSVLPPPTVKKTTPTPSPATNHSLVFTNGQTTLSKDLETHLKTNILPLLAKNSDARIQILSFASPTDGTESSARRVSLSRALVIRDYLLSQKIKPERIDVRALAGGSGSAPSPDRIDIVLLNQ